MSQQINVVTKLDPEGIGIDKDYVDNLRYYMTDLLNHFIFKT